MLGRRPWMNEKRSYCRLGFWIAAVDAVLPRQFHVCGAGVSPSASSEQNPKGSEVTYPAGLFPSREECDHVTYLAISAGKSRWMDWPVHELAPNNQER
ncbi:hypothetical protein BO82DRAFT_355291 [Aspergillus uvarum CBS 121591]|uniref:Uncharacterized protein n=1 Tax=Aspergillus uvarum CBS 121591 TaxID=1448315 RepID=A0A319C4F2_9EURO|nr:hypothetical protein BO82DRAFT_355291 [Aspergillus uvarum CBS 121591]PYH80806.1 hypothetical protein BO82DRAFT_355291 [Aspergillus uvarum CBS 121591]